MPRLRIIRPNYSQLPAVGRLSREARLLHILMWPVADDAGRLRFDPDGLVEQLYPFDTDAPMLLASWLDELEREGCIERYGVDGIAYLRVVHWRRLQSIQHPKRSRLPASPSEPAHHDRHDDHEESPETQTAQASEAILHDGLSDEEIALLSQPGEITPARVLGYLDFALRKSLVHDDPAAHTRCIELAGRHAGLWGNRGAAAGRKETTPRSKSPDELLPGGTPGPAPGGERGGSARGDSARGESA